MAKIADLDSIDRKILGIIQEDCTLSVQQLAERVGLSANPCWRRVKRLEAEGVIRSRVAVLDPQALGLALTAFVAIRTNRHDADWLAAFAAAVARIPEIVEAHRMSGDVDYMLKVLVADIAHYDRVYRRLIAAVPGLIDVSSTFSMERLKSGPQVDVTALG
ncbi:MAG: Lrp/AsnC family transcriptional regulator [Caulobacteraceae bacterium]|nr:Lrp/AsnC family transcriptional regulator [Caulobacteraceae bacterium]